ncbi:RNA-guided endonuclease InsQ/TnpB family protein [sulfur-oxidizing endosymbiont of Gigantopelta aegis]|uniref:RNA-guided endonuclease InsQ/TnpB family protein n=1 Tax=sulfur-oxidizing endosymbiont of Gigantopelta aegis TaxID=2794934 RepID=UPI0018DC0F81|nr:RNA-guided endonuclease TnpB family protein [sulfur-oxidizing endosymbiont of Gigantopelta aegis]
MIIRKAYKYRLNTNAETEQLMSQYAGNCRYLWNKALRLNLYHLENKQPMLWYQELDWFSKLWKKSDQYGFLKLSPAQTLQQTLKQLERAFKDAFDKKQPLKKIPTPKKRGDRDSFSLPQGFKIEGRRIFLPKIGWVNFRKSREIEGTAKNVTVSRQGKYWFVSIQVEMELPESVHSSLSMIGVDMGVKRLFTLSDGEFAEPIDVSFFKDKIKRLQKSLARKIKFSNHWRKLKEKINRLHTKIANIRHDTLHKLSTALSKSHAMIVLESLQIKNMTKSAKGDMENPGAMVKQKSGLNRVILEQGWGMFKTFLQYKQRWSGGQVLFVDPKYTSQTCPMCQHRSKDNRKTQSEFECVVCHHKNHADVIGAINVLERGHRLLACGETGVSLLYEAGTRQLSNELEPAVA